MAETPPTVAVIHPVDWHCNDNPDDFGGDPYYRSCDLCFGTVADDIVAGLSVEHVRGFWFDAAEGLSVCEHCIDGYLAEKPED